MRPNRSFLPFLRRALLAGTAAALLAGCVTAPAPAPAPEPQVQPQPEPPKPVVDDEAETMLQAGIRHYNSGEYALAGDALRYALRRGLDQPANAVRAHKYLAFILCTSGRRSECRDAFREAFKLDPRFELSKAEAGHPMWGPVYLEVRKQAGAAAR